MKYKDYYETLGLPRTATQDDIKRTYRKLARKYHPDLSKLGNAEERFKEVGEAYKVLKDTEKRAAYDRIGDQWHNGQDFQPPPQWDEGFEFRGASHDESEQAQFSEFFESLFGVDRDARMRQDRGSARGDAHYAISGHDHHAKMVIDLEDAYHGVQRSITLDTPVLDTKGRVTVHSRTLNVSIPKGVREGQHVRLAGQGGAGIGQRRAGDLYLEIGFRDHAHFRVTGRDVSIDVPVAPWEAALGARIMVPTPDGTVEITVPQGSGGGRRLRLKGKGIPGTPPGDLYVQLNIVLPPADSDSARASYESMRQAFAFDPRAHFASESS